jgi:hypothetical protein
MVIIYITYTNNPNLINPVLCITITILHRIKDVLSYPGIGHCTLNSVTGIIPLGKRCLFVL